jgi:protein tyrosine phosphatase
LFSTQKKNGSAQKGWFRTQKKNGSAQTKKNNEKKSVSPLPLKELTLTPLSDNDFNKIPNDLKEIPDNLKEILQEKLQEKLQNNLGKLPNNFDISSFVENNKTKNRYSNFVPDPYNTMVTLKNTNNDINTSYINANYVASYNEDFFKYIATQCPRKETFNDFWRMVFEEKSNCIVMLTNLVEKEKGTEKEKCNQYWPQDTKTPQKYGDINVTLVKITEKEGYEIRKFNISKNDSKKNKKSLIVHHYWFKSWPDLGVPDPKGKETVIEIIKNCNKLNSKTPWIVHCSAGVGRTGTFIAIDHGMSKIQNYKLNASLSVSVIDIIKFIRRYRNNLVQGYKQVVFVKETLDLFLEESKKKKKNKK